jgi:hypothetical protein
VVAIAVAAGAVAQRVTGYGFSLVCAPFLIAALGAREGVRTSLELAVVLCVISLSGGWQHARLGSVVTLLVPAVMVTPAVAFVIHRANGHVLAGAAGVVTLASAAVLSTGVRLHRATGPAGAVGAAVLSGAMNMVAGISGPPIAMYAVNAGWTTAEVRSSLPLYFGVLNLFGLAALGLPQFRPGLFVALVAGAVAGRVLAVRLSDIITQRAVLTVAVVGGVAALARAV